MPDDDRRRIEYVPVDPKAYGLGLLLGWLYNNRKALVGGCGTLLILALVVAGIVWLGTAGLNLVRYGTIDAEAGKASVAATEQAAQQTALSVTTASQQALAAQGLARVAQLREQGLALAADGQFYAVGDGQTIRMTWLAFAPDGLRVYFDSTAPVSDFSAQTSCLGWQGQEQYPGVKTGDWNGQYLWDGLYVLPVVAQVSARPLGNDGLYKGVLVYPYTVFPTDASMVGLETRYFFMFRCNSVPQIPLFDLAQSESWSVADYVDVYTFDLLAREQNEEANSYMHLATVEHVPGSDSIRIGVLFVLDEGARGFFVDAPDAVYIEIAGESIAPIDWGGASQENSAVDWGALDEIDSILCWDCNPGEPPSPVWFEFAGVWDKIERAGCFEFRYGTVYDFPQVCIDR
jgi:hypothetical protein